MDIFVIDVQADVVFDDSVLGNSSAHDHPDANVLPDAQVYPAYAQTFQNQSRTSLIDSASVSSLALVAEIVQL